MVLVRNVEKRIWREKKTREGGKEKDGERATGGRKQTCGDLLQESAFSGRFRVSNIDRHVMN
jgi:hypothetical protein